MELRPPGRCGRCCCFAYSATPALPSLDWWSPTLGILFTAGENTSRTQPDDRRDAQRARGRHPARSLGRRGIGAAAARTFHHVGAATAAVKRGGAVRTARARRM
eukprot:7118265-Prymnesium_polylepis.2